MILDKRDYKCYQPKPEITIRTGRLGRSALAHCWACFHNLVTHKLEYIGGLIDTERPIPFAAILYPLD
jgi:hypothetical protein